MANVSVNNTNSQLSGKTITTGEGDWTVSGAWTFSGNQAFTGNVSIGNAVGDTLTVTSTIISNLIFTDNTYDIGASGATRPRDLFLARNGVIGGTLGVTGVATFTAVPVFSAGIGTLTSPTIATPTITGLTTLTGGQIGFPASQSASADANTLDDYEEGTWTPVIGGAGGTSGQTYTAQTGTYTKIGRFVHAHGYVALSAKGTITGNVEIQGLPFTAGNYSAVPINWQALNVAKVYVVGRLENGTTKVQMMGIAAAATTSETALVTADITNTTAFMFSVQYNV